MGHDHTHPVIVAFLAGVILYLVFTDVSLVIRLNVWSLPSCSCSRPCCSINAT